MPLAALILIGSATISLLAHEVRAQGVDLPGSQLKVGDVMAGPSPSTLQPICSREPTRWMQRALDTWAMVARDAFMLPADSLPWIVLFDEHCAWHLAARGSPPPGSQDVTASAALRFSGATVVVHALVHRDTVRLPSGNVLPARRTAFAGLYRADSASFVVMALPQLWRRGSAAAADPTREEFLMGVFAHEMAHTVHLAAVSRRVRQIGERWTLPDRLNDDVVQTVFDSVPAFRQAVGHELDLLARAAGAADDPTRRRLTRQALASADARRRGFFTGPYAVYAPLEDLFLLMEGVGSWAAFRVAAAHAAPGTAAPTAPRQLQQGRYWSQDLGVTMLLVLDALMPDWRQKVFAAEPPSIYALLAEASRDH